MPKNFLVGIGGSGARIAEAAMFLCASGYGPDKLFHFLIDPDKGNGNLNRTAKLISKYLECRRLFDRQGDTRIFHTELIVPQEEKDRIWNIFDRPDYTLSEWLSYDGLKGKNEEEYDLISILFSQDELSTKLNEGFRGHPAIGSVVMTKLPEYEFPFKLLWNEIPDSKAFDIRLFLVGSVFGGTGAAGFPTLGHKNTIKYKEGIALNEKEGISKVLLGGALILPYFKVVKSEEVAGMYVTSNDFPLATKSALEFYDTKDSLGIDQIYFIGDSLAHDVGKFSYGSNSQNNNSHYIELISSLAAFDFFEQQLIGEKNNLPMYFISKRETERIDWKSFPVSRDESKIKILQDGLKAHLTTMTVFCFALVTYCKSILDKENDSKNKNEFYHQWFKEHFNFNKNDDNINPRTPKNELITKAFFDFAEEYLNWIISISNFANTDLFDSKKIVDEQGEWRNPVNQNFIGEILKEPSKRNGWVDKNGFIQALNDENVNNKLSNEAKSMLAANKLINLFYEGSKLFTKNNFTITFETK